MERKFKITLPLMPNYLSIEMPPVQKQDGFQSDRGHIPIGDLTREEAEEYAELMKQEFIKHWELMVAS